MLSSSPHLPNKPHPRFPAVCRIWGKPVTNGSIHCPKCAAEVRKERFVEVARLGPIANHSPMAETRRSPTRQRHAVALKAWRPSDKPGWLDEKTYMEEIQPRLGEFPVSAISSALRVSHSYATDIRAGRRIPHARHWQALAKIVGVVLRMKKPTAQIRCRGYPLQARPITSAQPWAGNL